MSTIQHPGVQAALEELGLLILQNKPAHIETGPPQVTAVSWLGFQAINGATPEQAIEIIRAATAHIL